MEPAKFQAPTSTSTSSSPLLNDNRKTDKLFMQLNASELSAINMKGSPNSNDRDGGFYSGSSVDGDSEDSPIIDVTSIDSSEMNLSDMLLARTKRKSCEPTKLGNATTNAAMMARCPPKKRIRYASTTDSGVVLTPPIASPAPTVSHSSPPPLPFIGSSPALPLPMALPLPLPLALPLPLPLPLTHNAGYPLNMLPHDLMPHPAQLFLRHPGLTTLHQPWNTSTRSYGYGGYAFAEEQKEPLALVVRKSAQSEHKHRASLSPARTPTPARAARSRSQSPLPMPLALTTKKTSQPAPAYEQKSATRVAKHNKERLQTPVKSSLHATANLAQQQPEDELCAAVSEKSAVGSVGRPQQRNYKNMTRERRIEANARERSRVNEISATYEKLRSILPGDLPHNQKLSKLEIIQATSAYILTLGSMNGKDYSEDQSNPTTEECIEKFQAILFGDGKSKRKKDEN